MIELHAPEPRPVITPQEIDALRDRLWKLLGPLPERCPLQVQALEEADLGDLVREKFRYQPVLGEWVTGYVLRPKRVDAPLPGVVALHSHGGYYEAGQMEIVDLYPQGYGRPPFAGWGLELARRGYVVICQDQVGFESRSWINRKGPASRGQDEQFTAFGQMAQGGTLVSKLAYDTSRLIDVLVSRPDVDGDHVGAMGHSGGGVQSYNAAFYDPRVMAAVSNCGLTSCIAAIRDTRTPNVHGLLPGLALQGDRAAAVATMAPRAFMLVCGSEDWLMPTDGPLNAYYRARKAYRALGVEERLEIVIFEGPHLFLEHQREMGYAWLDRWLKHTPIEPREVGYRDRRPDPVAFAPRPVDLAGLRALCGRYAEQLPDPRPQVRRRFTLGAGDARQAVEEVRIVVEDSVWVDNKRPQLEPPHVAGDYLRHIRGAVEVTDTLDVWVSRPTGAQGKLPVTLVLHRSVPPFEIGRDEVLGFAGDADYAVAADLNRQGRLVAAMDLFGHADRKNQFMHRRWPEQPQRPIVFQAYKYVDAGTSLLERSIHEVRAVVNYLRTRDDVDPARIDLLGFGTGGFVALMAAVLEPAVRAVTAVGGVTTQAAALARELHEHSFLYQPRLRAAGDVDHALTLLAPRPCRLFLFEDDPDWPAEGARAVCAALSSAYRAADAREALHIEQLAGPPHLNEPLRARILAQG